MGKRIKGYVEQECERVRCRKGKCIGRNRALGPSIGNVIIMMIIMMISVSTWLCSFLSYMIYFPTKRKSDRMPSFD